MSVHVPYTQSGRMMAIATRLGPDVLLLDGLDVDEGVNGLFTIRATVKSQRDDLGAADLIGSSADFSLRLKDEGTRWWNGLVTELHAAVGRISHGMVSDARHDARTRSAMSGPHPLIAPPAQRRGSGRDPMELGSCEGRPA